MDDNILAHYTNESTFVIDLKDVDHDLNGRSIFDITLIEIEANTKSWRHQNMYSQLNDNDIDCTAD